MKKAKNVIVAAIVIFTVLFMMIIISTIQSSSYDRSQKITAQSLAEEANQKLVVLKIENHAIDASIESGRNIPSKDLLDLSVLVKSKFNGANWFSNNTGSFYIKYEKSEQESVLTISDGAYCVKITIDNNHKLTSYNFVHEKCRGYQVYATNSD